MSRWTVTYTQHIKQKRKVYQDGILELSGGKVLLYDDGEKLIDSRFLKKDEVVECGGMLTFDTHLVDIGDPEVGIGPSADLNVGLKDENLKERAGAHGQKLFYLGKRKSTVESLHSKNDSKPAPGNIIGNKKITIQNEAVQKQSDLTSGNNREWNALYTTQITQKSKRYHDGILRLVTCGSHMNQVILLNEDGAVLSSKHLKSVERIRTGQKCEFPNYLVEICVQRTPARDVRGHIKEGGDDPDSGRSASLNNRPTHDDIRKGHAEKVRGGVNSESGGSTGLNNRPTRDVTQILSSLKRPDHTPQPSDVLLDVENKNKTPEFNARKPTEDNHISNTIVVDSNCPGKQPSHAHSMSSDRLSGLSCGPVNIMDKIASPSGSPAEDHICADKNRSLTDEIMALQQEWTNLSYRVSTINDTKSPRRPVQDNAQAGERCEMVPPLDASLPPCVATEARRLEPELHSSSNTCIKEDHFPTFDLGFE